MTTTDLNTKVSEVEKSGLAKKLDYDAKILETEGKYFTTSDYNKFTSDILYAKIKQEELVNKSDTSNFSKISADY